MKLTKFYHKSIVTTLIVLVIIASTLIMAVPVSAAVAQEWPLSLVGYSTLSWSKADFNAAVLANPTIVGDSNNSSIKYKGLAVWRIVAMLDGGDPATLNISLISSISVKGTCSDDYANTALTPAYWYGTDGANKENVIVYNLKSTDGGTTFVEVAAGTGDYPCKVFGLQSPGGSNLSGTYRPGKLVKLELLGLPALPVVNVSISPSSQAVANGATFNVNLAISTDTASRGWQANIDFDASKLIANSVTEGGFLHDWAIAHSDSTNNAGTSTIDNVGGHITNIAYAVVGTADLGGPTGSGTLCSISFTAKTAIDNYASLAPSAVVVSDVNAITIPGVTLTGGQVAIGNVPMADLVVSAASTAKVDDTHYTITYTITNQGNLAAVATVTSIAIDGVPVTAACPALAAGASDTQTTASKTLSAPSDTIVITADSTAVVSEGNESNNTRTITYANVSGTGDTIVNGNIAAKLSFTAPTNIDPWNLIVGPNDISGTMNVKCNSDWQVQVSDQNTDTAGHMTKWMSTYVPGVKLTAPLTVGCTTSVDLSGAPQTIVNGTPSGQVGNNGQDCTVLFHQAILYSDAVLTGGYSYHIVVTFTASVTI